MASTPPKAGDKPTGVPAGNPPETVPAPTSPPQVVRATTTPKPAPSPAGAPVVLPIKGNTEGKKTATGDPSWPLKIHVLFTPPRTGKDSDQAASRTQAEANLAASTQSNSPGMRKDKANDTEPSKEAKNPAAWKHESKNLARKVTMADGETKGSCDPERITELRQTPTHKAPTASVLANPSSASDTHDNQDNDASLTTNDTENHTSLSRRKRSEPE